MKGLQKVVFDPKVLEFRHCFNRAIRNHFDGGGFLEIETPILIKANTPDPHIDPIFAFASGQKMQMHTSPEAYLKKALGLGLEKIYQLGRVFRDDPPGPSHSREFTMLEWYRVHGDLIDMIEDCQQIFAIAHQTAEQSFAVKLPNPTFKRFDLPNLFQNLASIDLSEVLDATQNGQEGYLRKLLFERGDRLAHDASFEEAFFHVMLKYIEPNLDPDQVSVVERWPIQLAALSAIDPTDDRYCQRFELYYQGREIANAYQECSDPAILIARFEKENKMRQKLGKALFSLDYELIYALSEMPKTAGIALGIDRLLISFAPKTHLKEIIFGFQEQ